MDKVAVRFSMSTVITDNRVPFSINQGLKLNAKFNDLVSFPDMTVSITVLAIVRVQVNDEFSLTHVAIIQQDLFHLRGAPLY